MTASPNRSGFAPDRNRSDPHLLAEWKTLLGALINSGARLRFFPHRTMMFVALAELADDRDERAGFLKSARDTLAEFDAIVDGFTKNPSHFGVSHDLWPWLMSMMEIDRADFDQIAHRFSTQSADIIQAMTTGTVKQSAKTVALSKFVATSLLGRMNKLVEDFSRELADVAVKEKAAAQAAIRSGEDRSQANAYIIEVTDELGRVNASVHMISINAMIQAARAGESGKAFAIIAAEIQKLSAEIRVLTTGIQAKLTTAR